jgi:prepilin-type processing-associated H-X9-DG protein
MYVNDNDGKSIYYTPGGPEFWIQDFRPYYGNIDTVRFCPEASDIDTSGAWGTAGTAWTLAGFSGSYGMNSWLCRNFAGNVAPGYMYGFNDPTDTWELPVGGESSEIPLFGDCNWVDGFPLDTDPPPTNLYTGGQANPGDMNRFCIVRHFYRTNIGFLDGHCESMPLSTLWRLKWNRNFTYQTVFIPGGA